MEATITIDATRFNEVVADLQAALGNHGQPADCAEVIRDEARRLIQEIVKDTPPQTIARGEGALSKDLNSLFSPAGNELIDDIGSKFGLRGIDTFLTKKDGSKMRLLWDYIDPLGERMPQIHAAARNRDGRISEGPKSSLDTWRARNIVPGDSLAEYKKKMLARVGRQKASWIGTAENAAKLGIKEIKQWISRHFPTPKTATDLSGLLDAQKPHVVVGSRAPGVSKMARIVRDALRIREEAIRARIKLIWADYAQDVVQRRKITTKAKRSGQGGRYAIG